MYPTLPYFVSREPKMILPALPGLLLGVVCGFNLIFCSKRPSRLMTTGRLFIWLIIAGPWIVGLRVDSPETSWGPGFEIRPPSPNVNAVGSKASAVTDEVDKRRVSIGQIHDLSEVVLLNHARRPSAIRRPCCSTLRRQVEVISTTVRGRASNSDPACYWWIPPISHRRWK